jgi:hypothetical protein
MANAVSVWKWGREEGNKMPLQIFLIARPKENYIL